MPHCALNAALCNTLRSSSVITCTHTCPNLTPDLTRVPTWCILSSSHSFSLPDTRHGRFEGGGGARCKFESEKFTHTHA